MKEIVFLIVVFVTSFCFADPKMDIEYKNYSSKVEIVDKYETYKNYVSYLEDKTTIDEKFIELDETEQVIFIVREMEILNEKCYKLYKLFVVEAINKMHNDSLDAASLQYANKYFELCKIIAKKQFDFIDESIKNIGILDRKQLSVYKEKMKKVYIKRGFIQK